MKVTLAKFTDEMYVNLIRQICMCRVPALRPVAFKVGEMSNVAEISSMVEEDMSEFISNMSSAVYKSVIDDEVLIASTKVSNKFNISDLTTSSVQLVSGDCEALHVHAPITVTVIFRKASGVYTEKENRDFLEKRKVSLEGFTVINSRHCVIKKFQSKKVEEAETTVEYEIRVVTDGSILEDEVVETALKILQTDANLF